MNHPSGYGGPPPSGAYHPPGAGGPPGGGFGAPPGGGGGFGPPGGPGSSPGGPAGPRTDGLAIVALVAGLIAVVGSIGNLASGFLGACCFLCGIGGAIIGMMIAVPAVAALVTGILSARRIDERPAELTGKGIAISGAVCGGIALLMTIATILLPVLGFGCAAAGQSARPVPSQGPYGPTVDPAPDPWAPAPAPAPAPYPDPTAPYPDPAAPAADPSGVVPPPPDPAYPPPPG